MAAGPVRRRADHGVPVVTAPTLDDVLDRWRSTYDQYPDAMAELKSVLLAREDAIVGLLHLAGMQFGLFPQIVAEVLAQVGLGTPKGEEERAMIRASFTHLMEEIQRAQRGDGPMPTP